MKWAKQSQTTQQKTYTKRFYGLCMVLFLTGRITGRISSFFSFVISMPCVRASLSGPIEASFTRFFMSDPEYPVKENCQARKPHTIRLETSKQQSDYFENQMNLACIVCGRVDTFSHIANGINFLI